MKVLHFFKTYQPETVGGVETVITSLAEGMLPFGVDSEVLYLSKRGASRNNTFLHHKTHTSSLMLDVASTGLSYSVIQDFKELASEVDLVHYHFPWPMMDLAHFAVRHGKPSVVSYHSDIIKQKYLLKLYKPLMHRFFNDVDSIVASSPNYAESSDILIRFKNKLEIIPYGIEDFSNNIDSDAVNKWREHCGEGFFLFVGMLRYYKGLSYLLEAANITGLPVVIAGAGADELEIKAQAQGMGLNNVKFVGRVNDNDKSALLHLCKAFVFPSHLRSESFGISLLEAAVASKPMISCEIGTGTTFVNIHNKTGFSVPPKNSVALAHAMNALNESGVAARLGLAARKRYESTFTREKMSESYYNLYRALLK